MMHSASLPQISEIIETFAFLDDWEDRYRYLIDLGRALEPLPESARTEDNLVRGCASQVWLYTCRDNIDGADVLVFHGDSDAHIVRGLVALTLSIFSGQTPGAILALDPAPLFARLGLAGHLTPQRSNGLASMVARIKSEAARASDG